MPWPTPGDRCHSTGTPTAFVASSSTGGAQAMSSTVPVDVEAAMRVRARRIAVLTGQTVQVRGRLLPAQSGRKVSLQAHQNGAWRTLATARSGSTICMSGDVAPNDGFRDSIQPLSTRPSYYGRAPPHLA